MRTMDAIKQDPNCVIKVLDRRACARQGRQVLMDLVPTDPFYKSPRNRHIRYLERDIRMLDRELEWLNRRWEGWKGDKS